MKRQLWALLSLMVLSVGAYPASAELDEKLLADGWDEIEFDEKTTNQFTAIDEIQGLSREVEVRSKDSVSIAFYNLEVDINQTPRLTWSWKSFTPVIDTDTTVKGGDDRTLALYIAFPYQPEEASFGDRLRRQAVELINGADTPDRILTYVWGGGAERGDKIENPYAGENGQFIYLRTPEDGQGLWFDEEVNIYQDFVDAFGFEPASPVYIGIGSDSDDTDAQVSANVKGLAFKE